MKIWKFVLLILFCCMSSKSLAGEDHFSKINKINYYKNMHSLSYFYYIDDENSDPVIRNDSKSFDVFNDLKYAVKIFISDAWHITKSPTRINRKGAICLGGIALTTAIIYDNDERILSTIKNNLDKDGLKQVVDIGTTFEPIGYMGNTNKYYFAVLGIGYIFKIKKLETISAQILEANFIAGIYKNIANVVVGRARPHEGKGAKHFKFNDGTSFPSGHAVVIFNLATILSYHMDYLPFTIMSYGIASAVGIQRVESRGHYASDVFLGAILGIAVSKAILNLHEKRKVTIKPIKMGNSTYGMRISAYF